MTGVLAAACGDGDTKTVELRPPVVRVSGGIAIEVGATVTLAAATSEGTDGSYAWESSNPQVATVDAGVVTGVAPGEAIITATGADTGASGTHGVAVFAAAVTPSPQPTPPPSPTPGVTPTPPPSPVGIPLLELWASSGHADRSAGAFTHWDEDGAVPPHCARCHSRGGYIDYLGGDGSEVGVVDQPAAIGTTVDCETCHDAAAIPLDAVTFPSGVTLEGLGPQARCMTCHQGRHSTDSVNAHIADAAPADDDTVSENLGFQNVHYFGAGATRFGALARGGYQYEDSGYDGRFDHVPGFDSCTSCHNPHSLEVRVERCNSCHVAENRDDLRDIRMLGSLVDYDGDGDTSEGIAFEIEGLQLRLFDALQAYAAGVAGKPIVYDGHAYPYFFIDTDGDGELDEGEGSFPNRYDAWTARLVRAAYNYQFSQKDPGAYAHNAKYVIELLFDAIEDLNLVLEPPVGNTGTARVDAGHFAASEDAFRHWDDDGEVSSRCSRCHTGTGLRAYVETGEAGVQPPANGLSCDTCHSAIPDYAQLVQVDSVTFPSGRTVEGGENSSRLCMTCHQGRSAKVDVDAAIAGKAEDTVDAELSFLNVHYFAAGATRFGSEAQGGYEYDGQRYRGRFDHVEGFDACAECHDPHRLEVRSEACGDCHPGVQSEADLDGIRMVSSSADFDGDGSLSEGLREEIFGLQERLYAAIQSYATQQAGAGVLYDGHRYPYWFTDTDGDGSAGPGEINFGNRYASWTPRLLKAAYNYQYAAKDPGAFAHNGRYVIALLFDAIHDLAAVVEVDTAGLSRSSTGHFDADAAAFRHWDDDGEVRASCARCHAPPFGLNDYLEDFEDPTEAQPLSNGFTCDTCHVGEDFDSAAPRRFVERVVFPGGNEITNDPENPDDSFLCMTCHQGRVGKADIDALIDSGASLSFQNVHYLAAGATLYGSQAAVGYEYEGKIYQTRFIHFSPQAAHCTFCHEVNGESHSYAPRVDDSCLGCHSEATAGQPDTLRLNRQTDYDGDGNNTEALKLEIETLATALFAAIQQRASDNGWPIVYSDDAYPYFFHDLDGDGVLDPNEGIFPNRYTQWTAQLLKAAHNYQTARKEPGNWAHNTPYTVQLVYDAIEDLGGDVSAFNRP